MNTIFGRMFQERLTIPTLIFIYLFSLISTPLFAEKLIWETQKHTKFNNYTSYYLPSSKNESTSSVQSKKFTSHKGRLINIGYVEKGAWIKFEIENQSDEEQILLEVNNFFIDSIIFFQQHKNGIYEPITTLGYKTNHDRNLLEINIPISQSKQFLINLKDDGPLRFDITAWNIAAYSKKTNRESIFWAYTTGILSFIVFLNIMFYIIVKEKLYLIYAALVCSYIYTLLGNMGYIHPFIKHIPYLGDIDMRSSFNLILVLFSMQFLKYMFPKIPKIYHSFITILSFSPVLIIFQLLHFFGNSTFKLVSFGIFYLSSILSIITFFLIISYSLKKKYNGALLVLIGYLPVLLLYSLNILRALHIINIGFLFTNIMFYAYLFEIILMTTAVCMRFLAYKKEKEKYQIELFNQQIEFSNKLLHAQEIERKKIAQNLHDGVGQLVSGLRMRLSNQFSKTEHLLKTEHIEKMGKNIELIDEVYQEIRNISHELMPKSLQENGLSISLETLLQFTLEDTSIKWDYTPISNGDIRFEEKIEINMYRIAQEALNNIIKHAKAKNIHVHLYTIKNSLILVVEDDGIGFDMNKNKKGIGLKNINTRVNIMGGKFNIDSTKNKGTIYTIKVNIEGSK